MPNGDLNERSLAGGGSARGRESGRRGKVSAVGQVKYT